MEKLNTSSVVDLNRELTFVVSEPLFFHGKVKTRTVRPYDGGGWDWVVVNGPSLSPV